MRYPKILIYPLDTLPKNTREMHEADIILRHKAGSGFQDLEIIKSRKQSLYNFFPPYKVQLEILYKITLDLPRKKKKLLKHYIHKTITDYKTQWQFQQLYYEIN